MTPQERSKIVKEFFQKAIAKNLVINTDPTRYSVKTNKITKNVNNAAKSYQDFKQVFNDNTKLMKLQNFNLQEFGILHDDTERLLRNFFLFHALNYLESYKLILLEWLKQGIKIGSPPKKKISLKLELGSLVYSLSKELAHPDFEKLFPVLFRNVLGHSSWWWENNILTYDDNGTNKQISDQEFTDQMEEFGKNMTEMVDEYIRLKGTNKI